MLKQLKRNRSFLGLLLAQLITAGSALVINVIAARSLGPTGRGEIALFLQVSYMIGAVCALGRDVAFPATGDNRRPVTRRVVQVLAMPTALGIVAGCAIGFALPSGAPSWIGGAALAALVGGNLTTKAVRTAAICIRSSGGYLITVIVAQGTTILGGVVLTVSGIASTASWLSVYGASLILPPLATLLIMAYREPAAAEKSSDDGRETRELGLRLFPAFLFDFASSRIDRLILPALAGYAQLGLYTVFATMTELTIWPVRQYVDSSVPRWAASHSQGTLRPTVVILRIMGPVTALAGAVGVAIYFLAVPLYGEEYRSGVALIAPLTVGTIAHGFVLVLIGIAAATAQTYLVNLVGIATFLSSVTLYVLLIPSNGAMGAALGVAGGYSIGALVGLGGLVATGNAGSYTGKHRKPSVRVSGRGR